MNRKNKRTFLVLGLVVMVFIGLTPSIQYVLGVKPDKPDKPDKPKKPKKKAKEIEVLLEYEYSVYYPSNMPVRNIQYTILDGNNVNIGSGITDATGMITFTILASYNQANGKGIHIEFMWQGILVSLDNLESGSYLEIMPSFETDIEFRLDGILLTNQPINVWFEGIDLGNVNLQNGAFTTSFRIMAGEYTFKCAEFEDIVYTLIADYSLSIVVEDFDVIAKFELVSSFLVNKTGSFIIFTLTLSFEKEQPIGFCLLLFRPL